MEKTIEEKVKNEILDNLRTQTQEFHRPIVDGPTLDPPDLEENPLNLYTLPYMELVESVAECFYPPNEVTATDGRKYLLKVSDARVDRYILFRAAWEEPFRRELQLALRDLTEACLLRLGGKHFAHLSTTEQTDILTTLEEGKFSNSEWTVNRSQKQAFKTIFEAVSCGLMADPGYGGNHRGIGWYYTNFMTVGM